MIVGIDFGTCYSSAAIMNGLIPVSNIVKDSSGMGIPSLFMFSKSQNRELFGEQCLTGAVLRETDVVRNMKTLVREDPSSLGRTVTTGGRTYTVGEVIEKFLGYLMREIRTAAERSGEYESTEIEAVTITAPVGISGGQMMASEYNRLIRDAVCRITGLEEDDVRVLQEPVAAAISYLYSEDLRRHYEGLQKILVFDLGGGTLDVSIVEHDPATMEYRILAKEGDLHLGGNDWDAALAGLVLRKLGIEWTGTEEEHVRFENAVTRLKVELSSVDEAAIVFTMDGEDRFVRVSRAEFEEATHDLLQRAMDTVERAMDFDSERGIGRAVLVGGSSNMPQIAAGLVSWELFPEESVYVYDPSKAIAKGAALYSKMTHVGGGPAAGPKVEDMATLTYGFESRYHGERYCVYNMIYKGTQFRDGVISRRSETTFIPMRDDQNMVDFVIYESENLPNDSFDGDWFDFGNGEMPSGLQVTVPVPPEYMGRARQFRMWVTLSLDESGILDIMVTDTAGRRLGYATSAGE